MDYYDHCIKEIIPIYIDLYSIKKSDNNLIVKNKILYHSNYISSEAGDQYGLELKDYFKSALSNINCNCQRITLDRTLADLLYCIADMLNKHNRYNEDKIIFNLVGKASLHYSYHL